jgi:hypothetical protein
MPGYKEIYKMARIDESYREDAVDHIPPKGVIGELNYSPNHHPLLVKVYPLKSLNNSASLIIYDNVFDVFSNHNDLLSFALAKPFLAGA